MEKYFPKHLESGFRSMYLWGTNNKKMENLINLLKSETRSLLDQYINHTAQHANTQFGRFVDRAEWSWEKWMDTYGVGYTMLPKKGGKEGETESQMNRGEYNRKPYYQMADAIKKERAIIDRGLDFYVAKEVEAAKSHYGYVIAKLADRICKKGLNQSAIRVETARIGINLESKITDGEKSVKAWTVYAHGPVNRPHFRYLVK